MTTLAESAAKDSSAAWPIEPSSIFDQDGHLDGIMSSFVGTNEHIDQATRHFEPGNPSPSDYGLLELRNRGQAAVATAVRSAAGPLLLQVSGTENATSTSPSQPTGITHEMNAAAGKGKKQRARTEARLEQNAKAQRRYRERLKNEKQQLVDTVDSLAKRVRLLEQQSGTAAQDPWALVQQPTSTDSYSDTKNFLNDSPNMSPSATTPPKVLEILDVPAHTKRTTSAGSELDERTGNPFRGISRLVECNRCTQMEMHIAGIASKLSDVLDNMPTTQPDSQQHAQGAVDAVTESLLLQEIQTFVNRKSQLLSQASGLNDFEYVCPQEKHQAELDDLCDDELLHTLTTLIKVGMKDCDAAARFAPGSRSELLVMHHRAYMEGLRKFMLNRKLCCTQINRIVELRVDPKNASGGNGIERKAHALSLATERLQRNAMGHVKCVEDYTDSAVLEVLPPIVGAKMVIASAAWLKKQQHRPDKPNTTPLSSWIFGSKKVRVLCQTMSQAIKDAAEELVTQCHPESAQLSSSTCDKK